MNLRAEVPAEKIVNVEQIKCTKSYSAELSSSNKFSGSLKKFLKKTWTLRKKVTVEPFLVCYILPSMLVGLTVQNLCMEKSCLVNLQYNTSTCSHIMEGQTHNFSVQEAEVHTLVAKMTAWSFPISTALPGIMILFVGAWSDRTGNRKAPMAFPMLGKLISVIGLIFSTVFFMQIGMDVTVLMDILPPAMLGGRVVMTMAVYSYITDITTVAERTFRVGIITAILTVSRPVGLALSGIMTKRFGYYTVFSFACVFYFLGFMYIMMRLKERRKKVENVEPAPFLATLSSKDVVATMSVAFRPREGSKRIQIILIMLACMLIVGPVLGESSMSYWYTRYKFKFTEVDYSLFLTYSALVSSIGSFITVYLFSKIWKIEDNVIGMIACTSRIGACVMYAVAPTRTAFFVGPVLDMFSSAAATSLRSLATKIVETDEIGKASSLISICEALVPVIYSPIYSKVYLSTLSTFPGGFYLISAALAVPAFITLKILHYLHTKENNIEQAPENEERQVTRF